MKKALVIVLIVAAAAVAGFRFGQSARITTSPVSTPTPTKLMKRLPPRDFEPEFRKLARRRDAGAQVRLLQLAEQVEVSEIPELLKRLEAGGALPDLAPHVTRLAHRWAAINAERALSIADSLTKQEWKNAALAGALGGLAEKNPDAAIAQAREASGPKLQMWRETLETIAESDPARAHSLAETNLPPGDFQKLNWDLIRAWSERDASSALAAAQSISGAERDRAIAEIMVSLEADAAWSALEAATNQATRAFALPAYFSRMAAENPEWALPKIAALAPEERALATEAFGVAWARSDAKAAFDWVRTFPRRDETPTLTAQIFRAFAEANPDKMPELIAKSEGDERKQLVDAAVDVVASSDPEKAVAYARELGDQARFISRYAASDPARALQWAQQVPEATERLAALNATVPIALSSLAEKSPADAAKAAVGLPQPTDALRTVVSRWSTNEPGAVAKWIEHAPDGPARQAAVSSFVESVYESRPAEAAMWIDSITDPAQRDPLAIRVYSRWHETDPAAAEKWITWFRSQK